MERARFVTLPTGDVIWFCDLDRNDSDPFPFDQGNQAKMAEWINTRILGSTSELGPSLNLVFANQDGDSKQLAGILGTSVIIISGFDSITLAAMRALRNAGNLLQALSSGNHADLFSLVARMHPEYAYEAESILPATLTTPWDNFDDKVLMQPNRTGGIDYFILPDEKQVYIHVELGNDLGFAHTFFNNAKKYEDAYRQWLHKLGPNLKRTAYRVDENGVSHPLRFLPMSNVEIAAPATPNFYDFDANPPCEPPCVLRGVCSIAVGTFEDFEPGDSTTQGSLSMNLEAVALKPYCVDGFGDPCPNP